MRHEIGERFGRLPAFGIDALVIADASIERRIIVVEDAIDAMRSGERFALAPPRVAHRAGSRVDVTGEIDAGSVFVPGAAVEIAPRLEAGGGEGIHEAAEGFIARIEP